MVKAGGALVLSGDAREGASRAVTEARAALGDVSPSFAVLFASAHFLGLAQALVTAAAARSSPNPPFRSGWPLTSARSRRLPWSSSGPPAGAPSGATGSGRTPRV